MAKRRAVRKTAVKGVRVTKKAAKKLVGRKNRQAARKLVSKTLKQQRKVRRGLEKEAKRVVSKALSFSLGEVKRVAGILANVEKKPKRKRRR